MLFIASQCCFASEWYQICDKIYLKIDKVQNNYTYFWIKKLNNYDIPRVKNRKVSFELFYEIDNCSANTSGLLALYIYGLNGDVLSSYINPDYQNPNFVKFEPVVPQTNGEYMYNIVCNNQMQNNFNE